MKHNFVKLYKHRLNGSKSTFIMVSWQFNQNIYHVSLTEPHFRSLYKFCGLPLGRTIRVLLKQVPIQRWYESPQCGELHRKLIDKQFPGMCRLVNKRHPQ